MATDSEKRPQLTFNDEVRRSDGETTHHHIPVEFRTLSIHVTDSMMVSDEKSKKKNNKDVDDSEYFAAMDYHKLTSEEVTQRFNSSETLGLDPSAAETRLTRNGQNVLEQKRPNYFMKVFWYVFGGFCSILWIGVITFFLCWMPLSTPPIAPGGSPSVVNLALAILVVSFICYPNSPQGND
jgi:sodium/potassium-transporting ATPase subunit alpha